MTNVTTAIQIEQQPPVTEVRPLEFVTGFHEVRPLNPAYLERLRRKIREIGAKPYPLSVTSDGILYGGRHRYEAFKAEGLTECLMHIADPTSLDREAIELNKASEDALPMTFVDYAELVWRRLEGGQTQQQVADGLGWSRAQVSQYAMLQKIDSEAWSVIATTTQGSGELRENEDVAENATVVAAPFSENLLRNILDLLPEQQLDLCRLLAKGKDRRGHTFDKAEFKRRACRYRSRNALVKAAGERLAEIPATEREGYLVDVVKTIDGTSEYVAEHMGAKAPGPKFDRLIAAALDDFQQKSNVQIITRDIRHLTADDIPSESVDCIITDPPYPAEYVDLFRDLGELAARVLKPGGSLIAMTGQLYLPQYLSLLSESLDYHWTLAYLMPGGQAVQVWTREVNTFWKPLLWFTNGKRDARWASDVVTTPPNANDKAHHHWGQGIDGMREVVERFTNPGDVVLDPFMGGGTTGVAAKATRRKFIGVEVDGEVASKASARIHGGQGDA